MIPSEHIDLKDLRWAVIASQHPSLRRAAASLNVRQSTLSRKLKYLEHIAGAELFERSNGGTQPTLIGREFLGVAQRIIEEADAAFVRLAATSRGRAGKLTVGVYLPLTAGNLRATFAEYHRRYPQVEMYAIDGSRERLIRGVATSSIDVAILTTCHSGWDDRTLPLWNERVVAAVPKRHPLSDLATLQLKDLSGHVLLVQQNGAGPEIQKIIGIKTEALAEPRFMVQDVSVDQLISLSSVELGISLMLEGAAGAQYDGINFRQVNDHGRPIRLNLIAHWRKANVNPTLRAFLDLLRERYPDFASSVETT